MEPEYLVYSTVVLPSLVPLELEARALIGKDGHITTGILMMDATRPLESLPTSVSTLRWE